MGANEPNPGDAGSDRPKSLFAGPESGQAPAAQAAPVAPKAAATATAPLQRRSPEEAAAVAQRVAARPKAAGGGGRTAPESARPADPPSSDPAEAGRRVVDRLGLRPPRDLDEVGIPIPLIQDLTLRRALFEGRTSTVRLSEALGLSPPLMNRIVEELRELRYLEVQGMEGRDYILALTDYGREQAQERMRLSRYLGFVPVSLGQYSDIIRRQAINTPITKQVMRSAFADLVVNDRLIDELGPALIAEGAMFLYGPPGTGKTSIAERLIRIHTDPIVVPRAVEVDSQVIVVYDPVIHEPIHPQPEDLDPRWVLCRRPSIIAGGELSVGQLDLSYEANNGVYLAPLQMQAANGVFIIDDFGRQTMTPAELLNRWIVPLDRRIDYLSLAHGLKFEVPFETKVVLSTNLEPSTLGDEAFFRRIQNKIFVSPIEDDEFDEVLERATEAFEVEVESGANEYLRKVSREQGDGDLRPYLPREVCKILTSICQYEGIDLILNRSNIDRIASVYFTKPGSGIMSPWANAGVAAFQGSPPGR